MTNRREILERAAAANPVGQRTVVAVSLDDLGRPGNERALAIVGRALDASDADKAKRAARTKRPTITRATDAQREAYAATGPVYPLYGFITIDGRVCGVEDLRGVWKRPDPVFEIIAPAGYHFADDVIHSMLCADLRDVVKRASSARLVPCGEHCEPEHSDDDHDGTPVPVDC